MAIQSEQARRECKNYSGNFLNIRLTAGTWPQWLPSVWSAEKPPWWQRYVNDEEEAKAEVREWLTTVNDIYAAGFDALVKRWDKCIIVGGGYVEK
jgi:hypothetical protein